MGWFCFTDSSFTKVKSAGTIIFSNNNSATDKRET